MLFLSGGDVIILASKKVGWHRLASKLIRSTIVNKSGLSNSQGGKNQINRRDFIKQAGSAAMTGVLLVGSVGKAAENKTAKKTISPKTEKEQGRYTGIAYALKVVTVFTDVGPVELVRKDEQTWTSKSIEIRTKAQPDSLAIEIDSPITALSRVRLRWQFGAPPGVRLLGDHWERGYGNMSWQGVVPDRIMPWYFLINDGKRTHGWGVKTGSKAMCFWQADGVGISLWLDVRKGAHPILLGNRVLRAAEIVVRSAEENETPFEAAKAFCRMLCDKPRLPSAPVYGGNNWYYAYGKSSAKEVLRDCATLSELSEDTENRPFYVIDDGWQRKNGCNGSMWSCGNSKFPDMPGLAEKIRKTGCRPGIWLRPLLATADDPDWLLLPDERITKNPTPWARKIPILDPSAPEVRQRICDDIKRLTDWGYELIKHDYSTYDILGHWGFEMRAKLTNGNWQFADRHRTTAEIILDFYRAIRESAGKAIVNGCNTIGHLAAGVFELQRTGDDTSGKDWDRTRKMGVNSLAFRMPQHEAFFFADADCVGLTNQVPWEKNRQWLRLLAESGTALFVSASPDALGEEQKKALKWAFAAAAKPQEPGEPLDWMDNTCPQKWLLNGQTVNFDWFGKDGVLD